MLFNASIVVGMESTDIRHTSCNYKTIYTFHKFVLDVHQELDQEVNKEAIRYY